MKLKRIMAMVLCVAMVLSTMSFSVFAEESATTDSGYMLYIYNADGTLGMDIDGTKSVSVFCLRSAIEDARVFVNNAFLFGITTPATYVVEMYEDSVEDESFEIGSDVTINGNGHNIILEDGVELTNNGTINNATIVEKNSEPEVEVNGDDVDVEVEIAPVEGVANSYNITLADSATFPSEGVTMSFPAVEGAADGDSSYVVHEHNGTNYIYVGKVADGKVTIKNTVGFSTFTVHDGGLDEAVAAATENDTITLLSDAELSFPTNPMYNFVNAKEIDLAGHTMTIKEGNLRFSTCTIKNGNIIVDATGDYSGNGVFYMFDEKVLTLDNVKLTAEKVNGYSIFCMEGNSNLNLQNGTEVIVKDCTLYGIVAAVSNGENIIENSKIIGNNITGRGFLNGNYTVKGNSEITLTGVTKDGFYIGAGDTLNVQDTAKVDITLNADGDDRYGINLNGETAIYNKAATATVIATDNKPVVTYVAKIGVVEYATLEEAFKAATDGCTIEILSDVTIDYSWDCRDYATNGSHSQFKESVTINGNNYIIKFTGTINDNNWNTVFRFEENATVKNLTVDISEATGVQRVITAKKSLNVDKLTIVGSAKYGIIFGEGATAEDLANTEISITNSNLNGTRRAISDNEGAKDVKSVTVTGNTLNADVCLSAFESITFNNNTATGYVDIRSYTEGNTLNVAATENTLAANSDSKYNYIEAGGTVNAQDDFVLPATGTLSEAYTSATGYWGECGGNAKESFEFKLYNDNTYMGYTSLNDVGDIIDGSVYVSWSIKLDAASNTDEYWDMAWEIAPTVAMQPNRVEQWVDGVKVAECAIQPNWSDSIFPVVAAVTDADGKILSYVNNREDATLANAFANGGNITLLRDVSDSLTAIENVTLNGNNVTLTNTYTGDYVDFNNVTVGSGVTLNIADVFSSGSDSDNIIEGTLNVSGVYYHSNDAKTIIQNGGNVTTSGMTVMRYNTNADSGIYIYGDNNDDTVEFTCNGDSIGAYSGTFYAKDAVINTNMLWLDYKKNSSEESDSYAQINAQFVNSKLNVASEFRLYKDASLTLEGAAVTAGKVQIRQDATPVVTMDSTSSVKATAVENLSGASINAVLGEDGTVTFKKLVAKIGDVQYATLEAALDAAVGNDTIVLLNDIELSGTVSINKNITLDGNNHTITPAADFVSDGHNAALVFADGIEAAAIKNVTFNNFSGLTRVVRANFAKITIDNCDFNNNTVSEGVITSAYADLTVNACDFNNNTSDFAVINVGSDVSSGTEKKANITGNTFVGNNAGIAVAYLASSADVTGNYFNGNIHTGTNPNAAAILAGPYTGNMSYTININENAFVNAMSKDETALPAVFAEDWSSLGSTTAFDLSSNYWNGSTPADGYKTSGDNPNVTLVDYYTTYVDGSLGGLVGVAKAVAKIGDVEYESVAKALEAAKTAGMTDVTITLIGETTAETKDAFDLSYGTAFDNVTFKQEDNTKPYYINHIYTGDRTASDGKFIFDGVNMVSTSNIWFECDVVLKNNSVLTRTDDSKNFVFYGSLTIEPGSQFISQIDDVMAGSLIVDGGKTDGTYSDTYNYRSIFVDVREGQTLTIKNGAYVIFNAANELGVLTLNGNANVTDSKLDIFNNIAMGANANLNLDTESVINTKVITGAGTISIDATGFDGTATQVITADMSGFEGTISVTGDADYEITDTGLVIVPKPEAPVETPFKDAPLFIANLDNETVDGVVYHPVYMATSIDSLNYKKAGFDYVFKILDENGNVTFTAPYTTETTDVYDSISDANTTYTVDSIGGNGEYLFVNKLLFDARYYNNDNTSVSITPYAIDMNGNKLTGWTIEMTNEYFRSLQSGDNKVDMFKEAN